MQSLIFSSFLFKLLIIFSLFTMHYALFTGAVHAVDAPNPQPCQNAIETDNLTDHYVTKDNGDPYFDQVFNVQGNENDIKTVNVAGTFTIDFSKLQSLFAAPNYNYLEGNFNTVSHRLDSITGLNSQDFNSFHGPIQKAIPQVIVDDYRIKYIDYIYNKPSLPEAADTYTDINGQGDPKTIFDLVNEFGNPDLPNPSAPDSEKEAWLATWGKYWEKIPTSYDEFYKGHIQFRLAATQKQFDKIKKGESCPLSTTDIEFVLPQFFKTTTTADQLNQTIVPQSAQSFQNHETISSSPLTKFFANVKEFCRELFSSPAKSVKNILRISIKKIAPIKVAYAQTPSCLVSLKTSPKEGSAPFCALPQDQAYKAVSCSNKTDPNKLDTANPNVVCTFAYNWTFSFTIRPTADKPEDRQDDDFDSCRDPDGDGIFDCNVEVRGWPTLRIPYITEIYNSTYNSLGEGGISSPQEEGRPGIYKFFIPNSIQFTKDNKTQELLDQKKTCLADPTNQSLDCQGLLSIWQQLGCFPEMPDSEFLNCLGESQSIPGKAVSSNTQNEIKERFIGSTDCAKEFSRDFSLKPKALQEHLGISTDCVKSTP